MALCTVTGIVATLDSAGAAQVIQGAKVYLTPSRTDFVWTPDGGTTWYPWYKNENLPTAYQFGVEATTNGSGVFSFKIPFSDTEVLFPVGATTPALIWNITIPVTGQVFYGPTLAAIVGASKTIKELTQLADPNTWRAATSQYTGYPYGIERMASVTFNAGQSSLGVGPWLDLGTTVWYAFGSLRTDDTGITGWKVVKGSESTTGCTIELTSAPATGKTARVDLWVRPA
jgi:hypothetical protein